MAGCLRLKALGPDTGYLDRRAPQGCVQRWVSLPPTWVLGLRTEGRVYCSCGQPFPPLFTVTDGSSLLRTDSTAQAPSEHVGSVVKSRLCFLFPHCVLVSRKPQLFRGFGQLFSFLGDTDVSWLDSLLDTQAVGRAHRLEETPG